MASSAKAPPSDCPPGSAPVPSPVSPQLAASDTQASFSPPKPNPPTAAAPAPSSGNATTTVTTAPPCKASGAKAVTRASRKASRAVTATAPSRNSSGATTVAVPSRNPAVATAVSAPCRNPSGGTTIAAPSKKPSVAAAPPAAAARIASGANSTTVSVPHNSSVLAVVSTAVSQIPSAVTVTAMSQNPLWCATTSTATAVAPGSGVPPHTVPTRPEDYTPRMGMEFKSEQEAYDFYRYYGWKVGFNIRRRYTNRSKKTGEITSCKFSCSREGYKANDKRCKHTLVRTPDSRTGCNAYLVLQRKKPGAKLEVYAFQPRHNHPLFVTSFMPNPFQGMKLPDVVPPPDFVVNGDEPEVKNCTEGSNVACTVEGHRWPLRTNRQWEMKYGEAGALLNYFQEQSLADPLFYHAVQLDAEDKVANIFWADVRMINDYREFGDVVAFDVVSRNNINLRHFASFVGCNNFGECIVFGLALMYDETAESFWWLFETFLHAMAGEMPKTFFSHHDAVIAKAILSVMPDTRHAICGWHLKHTTARIVNQLVRGDCDFIKEFKACMNEYEEMEFLTSWDAMITKYDLRDNTWLQKLFEDKEKWARPYVKGFFSAGMKGTRLNERLQSDVRDYLRGEVDIVLFLKHLQKVINDRRHKELDIEYSSRLKLPYFKIKAPILIQASEAYTNMIFQLFQEEYEEFQSAYIVNRDESGPCREYVVSVIEKEKRYTVYGNSTEQTVSCSCRKFERDGFLCCHALKILDAMDIKYLPERYILKRWTKYARCLTSRDALCQTVQVDKSMELSSRYQRMCPKYARLVSRASESEESYRVLHQCLVELGKKVEEILQRQTSIGTSVSQPDAQNLKISLSCITNITESENVLDKSSSTTAKESKKKCQKSKTHPRNCIEKGLRKKQKVHSEQPAMQYTLLDASVQSGNAMFQDLEAPHNMPPLVNQVPAYKAYRGIDLSSPMGPINFEEMHSGLNPTFTQEIGFESYHTCQPSSNSQHNEAL